MDAYCAEIKKLEGKFYSIEYHHVVRDQNQLADHLSKLGSSRAAILPGVFVQDLLAPSIKEWWFAHHMVEHNLSYNLTPRLLSLQSNGDHGSNTT